MTSEMIKWILALCILGVVLATAVLVLIIKMAREQNKEIIKQKFCSDTQGTKIKIPKDLKLN